MSKFIGKLSEEDLKNKSTAQQQLLSWKPENKFLCCFDVDGHLLDNMTSKQMIVFQPHFMDIFGLRDIEPFYRIHAEHHNLWGKNRGCDRHEAKSLALGSLLEDPQLAPGLDQGMKDKLQGIKASIDKYIDHIDKTGNAYGFDSLHEFYKGNPDDDNLMRLLVWSKASDLTFPFVTIPMQPFPKVAETFGFVSSVADVLIVSKTPYVDICNWLEHHGLDQYVTAVAGKEQGGKDEHICLAMGGKFDAATKTIVEQGSNYTPDHVIMGGDGGGDLKAAKKNGAFFFPTPPGHEEKAWDVAREEVFQPLFDGRYSSFEMGKIKEFEEAMLPVGPWEEEGYDYKKEYRKLQPKREQLYQQLKPGGKLADV